MGKGSRNRQRHVQEQLNSSARQNKQAKKAPKWLTPLISILLAAVILVGLIASVLTNSGIIYRNRIIVESKTGNYDITQQTATFLAWQGAYYNAYYYWYYAYLGYITDKTVTTQYQSADAYAFDVARYTVQNSLRDSVQELVETLVDYVAVCDAAEKAGVTLDADDKAEIDSTLDWLKDMQGAYGFGTLNAFLKGAIDTGMKKSDIKHALEIVTLYNKYILQVQEDYEKAVVLSDLDVFRDENPDDYFKTDYLSFATEDKELAEKLAACTSADEFRETVVRHSFENNYKTTFNKYTVTQEAADALKEIGSKTDLNSTALTDALNAIGATEKASYTKESTDLPKEVIDWLFKTVRTQYEVSTVSTENGIYLVANYTEKVTAETTSVDARVKFYAFAEGESYGEDASFKSSMLDQLLAYKRADALAKDMAAFPKQIEKLLTAHNAVEVTAADKDTKDVPTALLDKILAASTTEKSIVTATERGFYYVAYVRSIDQDDKVDFAYCTMGEETNYRSGLEQQAELAKQLKEKDAKVLEILKDKNPTRKTNVTSSTASSIVPSAITKAVIVSTVKTGDILTASDSSGYYVIYVSRMENLNADITYVTYTNDTYYSILTALQSGLDTSGKFPSTSTQKYVSEPTKDSFEEWISASEEGFVAIRKEFDTKMIEKTTKNDKKEDVTTYTTYMVLNTPLYLDTDRVVDGGYVQFTDSKDTDKEKKDPHATQAADALAKLEGKEGFALEEAFAELGSAQISVFTEKAITDANVKAWLFDEARKENDKAVVTSEDGKSSYVVFFHESLLAWQSAAKTAYVTEQLEEWVDGLIETEGYEANEKVLDKLGDLTPVETKPETDPATDPATDPETDPETDPIPTVPDSESDANE